MDWVVISYGVFLVFLTVSPFIIRVRWGNSGKDSVSLRNFYMEELKDLKAEFDSGKLNESEFRELANDTVQKIKGIALPAESDLKDRCIQCGTKIVLPNAKFCPECGTAVSRNI